MTSEALDIGHGVTITSVGWAPDRELNPQYEGIPDIDSYGVIIDHPRPDGTCRCRGFVTFDTDAARLVRADVPMWTVDQWEPLTISPSVLCKLCGHHGFIRDGRWIPA